MYITRQYIQEHPNVMFIFGDNMARKGLGGAAKVCRGEPNCYGVITKRYPSNTEISFLYDSDYEEVHKYITEDFILALSALTDYTEYYIFPLGTGLAKLNETSSKLYNHIHWLHVMFDYQAENLGKKRHVINS